MGKRDRRIKEKHRETLNLAYRYKAIGKTSVLRVALSELDIPYVLVDARALRRNYSRSDLFRLIAQGLSDSLDKIKDLLIGIRGLSVMGVDVEVSWRGSDSLSLVELFDRLNKKKIVIAIDEAQRLRGRGHQS